MERAKAVKAGLTSDCLVLYNVFAPFSSIRFGTSDELVMKHLREDPDAILYALDVIAQDNALLCDEVVTSALIGALKNLTFHDEEFQAIDRILADAK